MNTPATLEGIAAGIDQILANQAKILANTTGAAVESITAIPDSMAVPDAIALAKSKGWDVQVAPDFSTVTFGKGSPFGFQAVKTVKLA